MSQLVGTVQQLQGSESQVQFASRLGIDQSELSRFLRGERGLTRKMAAALLRAYPDLTTQIVAELTGEGTNRAVLT